MAYKTRQAARVARARRHEALTSLGANVALVACYLGAASAMLLGFSGFYMLAAAVGG